MKQYTPENIRRSKIKQKKVIHVYLRLNSNLFNLRMFVMMPFSYDDNN